MILVWGAVGVLCLFAFTVHAWGADTWPPGACTYNGNMYHSGGTYETQPAAHDGAIAYGGTHQGPFTIHCDGWPDYLDWKAYVIWDMEWGSGDPYPYEGHAFWYPLDGEMPPPPDTDGDGLGDECDPFPDDGDDFVWSRYGYKGTDSNPDCEFIKFWKDGEFVGTRIMGDCDNGEVTVHLDPTQVIKGPDQYSDTYCEESSLPPGGTVSQGDELADEADAGADLGNDDPAPDTVSDGQDSTTGDDSANIEATAANTDSIVQNTDEIATLVDRSNEKLNNLNNQFYGLSQGIEDLKRKVDVTNDELREVNGELDQMESEYDSEVAGAEAQYPTYNPAQGVESGEGGYITGTDQLNVQTEASSIDTKISGLESEVDDLVANVNITTADPSPVLYYTWRGQQMALDFTPVQGPLQSLGILMIGLASVAAVYYFFRS